MGRLDLIRETARKTDVRKHLSQGSQVAITIRIPENLRDVSKELAALKGMSVGAIIRADLIAQLVGKG